MESLRVCFAKIKQTPSWDILCKVFLLCNILDIDSAHVLGLLLLVPSSEATSSIQNKKQNPVTSTVIPLSDTTPHALMPTNQDAIKDLVRYLASYKHTRAQYTEIFAQILDEHRCQVRSHVVIQSLKHRDSLKETRRQHAVLSGIAFRKPSLTQLIQAKNLAEGSSHPQDSFGSFCRASKLASNVNLRVKQVAYFLHCLPDHPDKNTQMSRVMGGDTIILACLQALPPIMSPDVQELRSIIMDTHYTVAPSETMRSFKDKCISSCLITAGKRSIHWTTVVRLYLAAYCRQEISKDLWCFVLQNESHGYLRASPETESMVFAFVKANSMALNEMVDIMLLGQI